MSGIKVKRLAELREKWEMDRISGLNYAKKEGIEEEKKKTAQRLLKLGIKIEEIEKITELSREEIEKLKENINK